MSHVAVNDGDNVLDVFVRLGTPISLRIDGFGSVGRGCGLFRPDPAAGDGGL